MTTIFNVCLLSCLNQPGTYENHNYHNIFNICDLYEINIIYSKLIKIGL